MSIYTDTRVDIIVYLMISRKEITRSFLDINKHIFSDTDIIQNLTF